MKTKKYSKQQFCGWFLRKSVKVKHYSHDVFIDIHRIESLLHEKANGTYLFTISHMGTHFYRYGVGGDVSPECLCGNPYETSEFYTILFQYDEKGQQYEITVTSYSADEFLKLPY